MSANNWANCPRCHARRQRESAALVESARATYGQVPEADYLAAVRAAEQMASAQVVATFREDYEFSGVETGTLTISYYGSCEVCDLTLSVHETRELDLSE